MKGSMLQQQSIQDMLTIPYPWHKKMAVRFSEQLLQHTCPHAILLQGVAGLGLFDLAQSFARAILLYFSMSPDTVNFEKLKARLAANQHPDLITLAPLAPGKPISIDQIREMLALVYETPQQAPVKVILIESADAMTIAGANALLKTLEQPTPNTYFILHTHHASRLLVTIRSRCQVYPLPVPSRAQSEAWLNTHFPDKDTIHKAYQFAGGLPKRAYDLLRNEQLVQYSEVESALLQMNQKNWLQIHKKWLEWPFLLLIDVLMNIIFSILRILMLGSELDTKYSALQSKQQNLIEIWDNCQQLRHAIVAKKPINQALCLEDLCLRWILMNA